MKDVCMNNPVGYIYLKSRRTKKTRMMKAIVNNTDFFLVLSSILNLKKNWYPPQTFDPFLITIIVYHHKCTLQYCDCIFFLLL